MEFTRTSAFVLAIPFTLAASAQITLTSANNQPVNGTSFSAHRGAYVAPAAAGAALLFDFSAAAPTSVVAYQWQDPAGLPNGAQFPSAQVALTNGGADTVFSTSTANGMERVGDTQTLAVVLMGLEYHFTTAYSDAILDLALPITYGNAPWTDLFSGTFVVEGNTATRNGSITGVADAWGWLIMPGGADTVEVLRVKTRIAESIPLNLSGVLLPVTHVRNTHAYYPMWGKYPLVSTVSDSLSSMLVNQNYSYTEWLDNSAVGVVEAPAAGVELRVFPNPAAEEVVVPAEMHTVQELAVYDDQGKPVLKELMAGPATLDVRQWKAGLYQVVITDLKGRQRTARLVVAH